MPTLPVEYLTLIAVFTPLFSKRIWAEAEVLLVGAIVAPGKRTVTAVLRVMGLSECRQFQTYHRVLNRAVWSSLQASRLLLKLLVMTFAPKGPLVVALDDTIERRRGAQIKAKGIYRDPVRSSHSHFVKASGLRWLSFMLLANIPWAQRVWALPFLTILAPSARYYEKKRRAHKMGSPGRVAAAPLVARTRNNCGGGCQFCRDFAAGTAAPIASTDLDGRTISTGRRIV